MVRHIGDDEGIGVAEGEVEGLDLAADAFGRLLGRGPPLAAPTLEWARQVTEVACRPKVLRLLQNRIPIGMGTGRRRRADLALLRGLWGDRPPYGTTTSMSPSGTAGTRKP